MTDQQTIERAILGKRVVAVSWLPIERGETFMSLEKITLEGGTTLELWAGDCDDMDIVFADIMESEHADIQG